MRLASLLLPAAILMSAPALAHEVKQGPNGGRIADAGEHHVELVVKNDSVDVFLSDHKDKAVSTDGFKGLAILAIDGKSQRIVLEPAQNRLSGKASGTVAGSPKGVVQITPPSGKTVQARFN